MHPVLNAAVGGWQVSGIYTYRSGEFLRFPGADVSGDPFIANPGPAKWFNTDAFKVQTSFTPRLNPYQYDGITGPFQNVTPLLRRRSRSRKRTSWNSGSRPTI